MVEVLVELGGVAARATLVGLTTRAAVARALAAGDVVVDARGRYALPHTDEAVRAAHRLSGVLSLRSAAAHWGWEQKVTPARPDVIVPRNRKLSVEQRQGVTIHRAALHADDIDVIATCRERTLVDCLRLLPFDEALAIAPDFLGRPDLVDQERRIILEADSFAWHGDRAALRRDARRYDEFVVNGWIVLRFAWEDVMHDQDWVREVLNRRDARSRTYPRPDLLMRRSVRRPPDRPMGTSEFTARCPRARPAVRV